MHPAPPIRHRRPLARAPQPGLRPAPRCQIRIAPIVPIPQRPHPRLTAYGLLRQGGAPTPTAHRVLPRDRPLHFPVILREGGGPTPYGRKHRGGNGTRIDGAPTLTAHRVLPRDRAQQHQSIPHERVRLLTAHRLLSRSRQSAYRNRPRQPDRRQHPRGQHAAAQEIVQQRNRIGHRRPRRQDRRKRAQGAERKCVHPPFL